MIAALHAAAAQYTFFSSSQGTFTRQTTCWDIKHTLTNLKEQKLYKRHCHTTSTNLEVNHSKIAVKPPNNTLLNNSWDQRKKISNK